MRKPKNSHELFHYWSAQALPEAKCGNVRYDGPVLYSYAEPIAMLLNDNRVLISNRNFSVTTSSHQSQARQATHHMRSCYAPYLPRWNNAPLPHKDNREYWVREAERAVEDLKRHPRRKKSVADRIASAVSSYNHYRDFFNLDWPEMTSDEMRALVEETAQKRIEEEAAAAKRREEQRLRDEAEEATELLFWRNHQTERRSFTKTALRLSLDGKEIETTKGAAVPVDVATRLWTAVLSCREHNKYWEPQVVMQVGNYKLNRIEADGTLVIGCHTIPFDELELMARKLGLISNDVLLEAA